MIFIAGEEILSFLMRRTNGSLRPLASLPLEAFLEGNAETGDCPGRHCSRSIRRLSCPIIG